MIRKRKKARQQHKQMELSYEELEAATQGFSKEMLVGHGSHGKVYKGVLKMEGGGKMQIAVKKPSSMADRSKHKRELDVLTSVSSPNLVKLVGSCSSDDGGKEQKLIVMEFMPNGSLHGLLHLSADPPGWLRRLLVALQIAQAVQALHGAVPPIIHRDIKSSNVLLDSNWDAKLADFSLSVRDISCHQHLSVEESATSTFPAVPLPPPPAGTIGYLDPSYSRPAKLGPKIDIFSYGVLLLELISGRRAMDMAQETTCLLAWASPLIKNGLLLELYDPRIRLSYNTERVIKQVVGIAARCVSSREEERPSAEEIVKELRQAIGQLHLFPPIWEHLRIDRVAKRIYPYLSNWWIMRRNTRRITSTTIICKNHLYEDNHFEGSPPPIQQIVSK